MSHCHCIEKLSARMLRYGVNTDSFKTLKRFNDKNDPEYESVGTGSKGKSVK